MPGGNFWPKPSRLTGTISVVITAALYRISHQGKDKDLPNYILLLWLGYNVLCHSALRCSYQDAEASKLALRLQEFPFPFNKSLGDPFGVPFIVWSRPDVQPMDLKRCLVRYLSREWSQMGQLYFGLVFVLGWFLCSVPETLLLASSCCFFLATQMFYSNLHGIQVTCVFLF